MTKQSIIYLFYFIIIQYNFLYKGNLSNKVYAYLSFSNQKNVTVTL